MNGARAPAVALAQDKNASLKTHHANLVRSMIGSMVWSNVVVGTVCVCDWFDG